MVLKRKNSTFFGKELETSNTIPELAIPPIPILIVLILGYWKVQYDT